MTGASACTFTLQDNDDDGDVSYHTQERDASDGVVGGDDNEGDPEADDKDDCDD